MNDLLDDHLDSIDIGRGYLASHVLEEACARTGAGKRLPRMEAIAPFVIGHVWTFTDTEGGLHVCQVDTITCGGKVFAYGENPQSFNGLFYQRVDKIPTMERAPEWLVLRALDEDDCAWVESMRADQLNPEDDREFIRNEDLPRW